jgi:hypothetical protein
MDNSGTAKLIWRWRWAFQREKVRKEGTLCSGANATMRKEGFINEAVI